MTTKGVQNMLLRVNAIEKELAARKNREGDTRVALATSNTWTWVREYAKTFNEHWVEEGRPGPYEHFPNYEYLQMTFDLLEVDERIMFWEKSRDMMLSWSIVAFFTLQAMTVPWRGVLFQTQKQDKVVQLLDYAKCL
jgi:hypothetical protein